MSTKKIQIKQNYSLGLRKQFSTLQAFFQFQILPCNSFSWYILQRSLYIKVVEGLGTCQCNGILVYDFLSNRMIFFHFSSTWFSNLQVTNNAFSADQLIIQKRKLDFSITKPCRDQFEATVFNQERLLYIVPSPSTTLLYIPYFHE